MSCATRNKVRGGCSIPGCSNEIYNVTRLADNTTVNDFFCATRKTLCLACMAQTPLCNEHYGTWYRHINPYISKCTSCNTNLSKSRLCPQPKGEVSHKDVVCYACYKSHLFAMKQQSQTPTPSTDADLSSTLERIKQEMPEVCSIQTIDQALIYCASLSALDVGKALLKQTALLLPNVYKEFHTKLAEVKNQCGILSSDIDNLSNPMWLRSQLCCLLEHHMWQTQVENEHYSPVSGLIRLVISRECFIQNYKNSKFHSHSYWQSIVIAV